MNRLMNPEFMILMLLAMVGVGYLMMLISKKKPKQRPKNPYVRRNERDGPP